MNARQLKLLQNWDLENIDYSKNYYFLDKKKSNFFNKYYVTIISVKNKNSGQYVLLQIEATEKNTNKVLRLADRLLIDSELGSIFNHWLIQKTRDSNLRTIYPEISSQVSKLALGQIKKAVADSILAIETIHQTKKSCEKLGAFTSSLFEDLELSTGATIVKKAVIMYKHSDNNDNYQVVEMVTHQNRKTLAKTENVSKSLSSKSVPKDEAIELVYNWEQEKLSSRDFKFKNRIPGMSHINEAKEKLNKRNQLKSLSNKGFGI